MAQKFYTNIEILADVTQPKHAATKEYVDLVFSRKIKDAVVDVISGDIAGSYDSTAKTLTQTTAAVLVTANEVTLAVGNRVLLADQTDKTQNGIYTVETLGVAESSEGAGDGVQAVLKRAADFDDTADLTLNVLIPVSADDSMWTMSNDTMPTLDTDPITFQKFSGEEGVKGFIGEFTGNDTDKEFTVTHGLGTQNFVASVQDESGAVCVFGLAAMTDNTLKVSSDVVLEQDEKFYIKVLA